MFPARVRRGTEPLARAAAASGGRRLVVPLLLLLEAAAAAAAANSATQPAADGQSEAPGVEDTQAMLQIRRSGQRGANSTAEALLEVLRSGQRGADPAAQALLQQILGLGRHGANVTAGTEISPHIPDATKQCILKDLWTVSYETMLENFKGRGPNPATICKVVPKPGQYFGHIGETIFGIPTLIPFWYGKELKQCEKRCPLTGKCLQRYIINQFFDNTLAIVPGKWFVQDKSWVDGKPAGAIEYNAELVSWMHDDLRPWCTCGVKMLLGVVSVDRNLPPTNTFIMVPPDAKPDDCPAIRNRATMCNP